MNRDSTRSTSGRFQTRQADAGKFRPAGEPGRSGPGTARSSSTSLRPGRSWQCGSRLVRRSQPAHRQGCSRDATTLGMPPTWAHIRRLAGQSTLLDDETRYDDADEYHRSAELGSGAEPARAEKMTRGSGATARRRSGCCTHKRRRGTDALALSDPRQGKRSFVRGFGGCALRRRRR